MNSTLEFGDSNTTWMGFIVERICNQGMAGNYGKIGSKQKLERYNVQYHCGSMEDMDCKCGNIGIAILIIILNTELKFRMITTN